jgi:3-deoxy-manno-octulosonate cytidylyltransferase (CMP-KDO synthetase)
MKVICVIPCRYQSSRFEGKPLADIWGKPMIQHVYERVLRSPSVSHAAIATDDERIASAVEAFGGHVIMTAERHRSGTDRIAEAVDAIDCDDDDIIVNIQGDQPLFEPSQIDEVAGPLIEDSGEYFCTLIYKIIRAEEIYHPNAVKVVFDSGYHALYFSRSTIPYVRDDGHHASYYKHHGIYSYRKSFLKKFIQLPPGTLEQLESLEQLRALEHGYRIRVVVTAHDSVEVDTPSELERVKRLIAGEGS